MRRIDVGQGGFNQPIVGESHYQDALRLLRRSAVKSVNDSLISKFLLARQPENPYDENAIAVLTEHGDIVGHLSREDAYRLQLLAREFDDRGELLCCDGKLCGDDIIGVWLNLPHLVEAKGFQHSIGSTGAEPQPEYDNLDVCRAIQNVSDLIGERRRYTRSKPNWVDSRIAAIGEERYTRNLERASKGRCENGERIRLNVLLVPDIDNPIDPSAVIITTTTGDVLGYLAKAHAMRWGGGIRSFFDSGRVICREAGLHQRKFKSGKMTFYLAIDMTDADWLELAAGRLRV